MTGETFLNELIASYHANLRPDGELTAQMRKFLERKRLSPRQWQMVYDHLTANHRLFPGIADFESVIAFTTDKLRAETPLGVRWQTFGLNGKRYARKIEVSADGSLQIEGNLPENAEIGRLVLPAEEEARDTETLNYEQALMGGYVNFSPEIVLDSSGTRHPGQVIHRRFEEIGKVIGTRQQTFSEYDDSPEAIGIQKADWSDL